MGDENETLDDDHDDEHEDDDDDVDDPKGRKKPKEVVLSQRRLNNMMTREKDEGRRAGRRAVLQELEVEDFDELKEIVDAHRKREDASADAATKAQREADKAKRDADAAREEAKKERHDIKVERALLAADVPAKNAAKVARLVDVEVGAEEDEIADAVDDLKEQFPHLFAPADDTDDGEDDESSNGSQGRQGPPRSDPGKPPRKKTSPVNTRDQAKSLLKERHPQLANDR